MILHLLVLIVLLQVIGFVWYGPLFGTLWGEITGMPRPMNQTPEEKKTMNRRMLPVMLLNIFLTILTVFTFFFFTQTTLFYPIPLALILLVGFVLPLTAGAAMWSGKPRKMAWKMFWVTSGYQFVAFLVMGVLYTLW